jgi:hypothetical protein
MVKKDPCNIYLLLPLLMIVLTFYSCDLQVVTTEPASNPYRTEHFIIHYDEINFTPLQIEQIGVARERNLDYVNNYLDCHYDRCIEIFISDTITSASAYATEMERISETPKYSLIDQGHEIAHIVSIQEWGHPRFHFLVEGLAVAAEKYDTKNAIENYSHYFLENGHFDIQKLSRATDSLVEKLKTDDWNKTTYEYDQAGAFIHFLKCKYSILKVKEWYQSTIRIVQSEYDMTMNFPIVFGMNCDSAVYLFRDAIVNKRF